MMYVSCIDSNIAQTFFKKNMATALITGASSGIGLALAKIHASKNDDLILVARNKRKLDELKLELEKKFSVKIFAIEKDLSQPNAASELYVQTQALNLKVDYLINNAGFGDFGMFVETDWEKEAQMIQVNMTTLTELTKHYLKDMVKQRKGRIMNVASTAAFQSGPTMAVYYATKAYVLHFSEALDNEVREFGVTVTALCPGATESGFQAVAAMEESTLVKGKKLPTAEQVAAYGYKNMMQGKTIAIHGVMNYIMANAVRFMPRSWVVKATRKVQDKAS
jgi:uncharacterized protein